MKNRPFLVKIVLSYFLLSFLLTFSFSIIVIIGTSEPISSLFLLVTIPLFIGLIILFKKPKPWHHTYCAAIGNISGFGSIIGFFLDIFIGENLIESFPKLLIGIITISIFLSFDFNSKVRKYFKKQ